MASAPKKKTKRVHLNHKTLKCQDPYYDINTRKLKIKMDLS